MGQLVTTPRGGSQVLDDLPIEATTFILKIMTRECRDLLSNLFDAGALVKDAEGVTFTAEMFNEIVRNHFRLDGGGYGIPVNEWLPGITDELREEIVNRVLANEEYQN